MNMKKVMLSLMLIMIITLTGCGNDKITGEAIAHKCSVSEGYTWDEEIGACIQKSELRSSEQKEAAKMAVGSLKDMPGIAVTEVIEDEETGTYTVKTTTPKEQDYEVIVTGEEVAEPIRVMTTTWCDDKGGIARAACEGREIDIGFIQEVGQRCCVIPS